MPEEKVYIGTKIVKAYPMDRTTYDLQKGNEAVGIINQDGYIVLYEDGYTSWSPKYTFERSYRLITEAEKSLIV